MSIPNINTYLTFRQHFREQNISKAEKQRQAMLTAAEDKKTIADAETAQLNVEKTKEETIDRRVNRQKTINEEQRAQQNQSVQMMEKQIAAQAKMGDEVVQRMNDISSKTLDRLGFEYGGKKDTNQNWTFESDAAEQQFNDIRVQLMAQKETIIGSLEADIRNGFKRGLSPLAINDMIETRLASLRRNWSELNKKQFTEMFISEMMAPGKHQISVDMKKTRKEVLDNKYDAELKTRGVDDWDIAAGKIGSSKYMPGKDEVGKDAIVAVEIPKEYVLSIDRRLAKAYAQEDHAGLERETREILDDIDANIDNDLLKNQMYKKLRERRHMAIEYFEKTQKKEFIAMSTQKELDDVRSIIGGLMQSKGYNEKFQFSASTSAEGERRLNENAEAVWNDLYSIYDAGLTKVSEEMSKEIGDSSLEDLMADGKVDVLRRVIMEGLQAKYGKNGVVLTDQVAGKFLGEAVDTIIAKLHEGLPKMRDYGRQIVQKQIDAQLDVIDTAASAYLKAKAEEGSTVSMPEADEKGKEGVPSFRSMMNVNNAQSKQEMILDVRNTMRNGLETASLRVEDGSYRLTSRDSITDKIWKMQAENGRANATVNGHSVYIPDANKTYSEEELNSYGGVVRALELVTESEKPMGEDFESNIIAVSKAIQYARDVALNNPELAIAVMHKIDDITAGNESLKFAVFGKVNAIFVKNFADGVLENPEEALMNPANARLKKGMDIEKLYSALLKKNVQEGAGEKGKLFGQGFLQLGEDAMMANGKINSRLMAQNIAEAAKLTASTVEDLNYMLSFLPEAERNKIAQDAQKNIDMSKVFENPEYKKIVSEAESNMAATFEYQQRFLQDESVDMPDAKKLGGLVKDELFKRFGGGHSIESRKAMYNLASKMDGEFYRDVQEYFDDVDEIESIAYDKVLPFYTRDYNEAVLMKSMIETMMDDKYGKDHASLIKIAHPNFLNDGWQIEVRRPSSIVLGIQEAERAKNAGTF